MIPFLIYLVKAAVCLVPFYGLYILVLRKLTFFRWNRYYLLASLALSLLIPILPSGRSAVKPASDRDAAIENIKVQAAPAAGMHSTPVAVSKPAIHISLSDGVAIFYLVGVIFTLSTLFLKLRNVYKLIHNGSRPVRRGKISVIFSEDELPTASFFSHVFIRKKGLTEQDICQILAHEASHARQLHSLDILFIEIIKVLWWFNPLIYFYKSSLQEIHEYEADQDVCRQYDRKGYASLLLKLGIPYNLAMANMFSKHPLKNRLKMLFGKHSPFSRRCLYILMLPLMLAACKQFGMHLKDKGGKNGILTLQSDLTALVIDGTTSLQSITKAMDTLRLKKNISTKVVVYKTDSTGEITDLQIDVSEPHGGRFSGSWDKSDWKKYRAIFIIQKDLNGKPGYCIGSTAISNTKDLKSLKLAFRPPLKEGKALFQSNCAACHSPLKDMTGPALAGMSGHYPKEWIQDFVHNSALLVAKGDTAATRLYDQWGKIPMTRFPKLKDYEIDEIFRYVEFYAKGKKDQAS